MKTTTSILLAVSLFSLSATVLHAQVAINNSATSPDASAILDLQSGNTGVNKGFLPQAVALTNITTAAPVTTPATGLIVYSSTAPTGGNGKGYYYWNGTDWASLNSTINGSGTLNYTARWTPDGTTLGVGAIQDNGTDISIGTTIFAGNAMSLLGLNEAVYAVATDASGGYAGVYGEDNNAYGVYGISGSNTGVGGIGSKFGGLFSATGPGVYAISSGSVADSAIGSTYGSYAYTANGSYSGVYGEDDGTNGYGVWGTSTDGGGVGVYGQDYTAGGTGLVGAGGTTGVSASGSTYGVNSYGGDYGGYFTDVASDIGEVGDGVNGIAGYFIDAAGDYGRIGDALDGAAGTFYNGSTYMYLCQGGTGYLTNGTKSTVVKDENNQMRMLFCNESPEVMFEDYGEGQLANGNAHISLDPLFARNVSISDKHPLRVFIQLEGDCNGVYVTNKSALGFDVKELNHGASAVAFQWHIVCNRANEQGADRDYAEKRFPVGPGAPKLAKTATPPPNINKQVVKTAPKAPVLKKISAVSANAGGTNK